MEFNFLYCLDCKFMMRKVSTLGEHLSFQIGSWGCGGGLARTKAIEDVKRVKRSLPTLLGK